MSSWDRFWDRYWELRNAGQRLLIRWGYGGLFLALGVLFLYWSARGLLAYESGTRAAWADPIAAAAGFVAAILSLWAGSNLLRRGVPASKTLGGSGSPEWDATLEEAGKLEHSDPQAASQLLENYFMREADNTARRREELRQRAEKDVGAAMALRKELQQDLENSEAVTKDLLKDTSADQRDAVLRETDEADRQLHTQLADLDAIIERHKLG